MKFPPLFYTPLIIIIHPISIHFVIIFYLFFHFYFFPFEPPKIFSLRGKRVFFPRHGAPAARHGLGLFSSLNQRGGARAQGPEVPPMPPLRAHGVSRVFEEMVLGAKC